MYYINDYRHEAIDKIIPYLIEFPQIVKGIEVSADRYQAIEDTLWNIADNFKVDDARGVFLDAHAHNEVSNLIYSDKADDAFTYGTDYPEKQAYGTGHYYSQASYLTGASKNVSEDKLIRAIHAKIIENNTNATIEDLIQALKLYYNADKVNIFESYPLNISLMLNGYNLEVGTYGNKDVIKEFLPACVSLKNLYVNNKDFNIYQLGKNTSYGESRYPIDITESYTSYPFFTECINLNSQNNEYIKTNHTELSDNMYCCFVGELSESYTNNVLFSSKNSNNSFYININSQLHFELIYNNTSYSTNILAEAGKEYTFIISNNDNKLKLWVYSGTNITGEDKDKDKDSAYILNQINSVEPSVVIDSYTTIENAPLYINGLESEDGIICGDFIYYGIVFGSVVDNINDIYEYYITSYGQKQVLFNCISNTNHLKIHSDEISGSGEHIELTRLQSKFKYTKNHDNSKYAYFDGDSNIKYDTNTQFNKDYFTKIGSPTITDDGIASGFNGSNYLYNTTSNYLNTCNTFTIISPRIKILDLNSTSTTRYMFTIGNNTTTIRSANLLFVGLTNTNKMSTSVYVDNQWISGITPNTVLVGDEFISKIEFNGIDYKFYYKLNNSDWILSNTYISSSKPVLQTGFNADKIRFGINWYNGYPTDFALNYASIDLKQFSITVDGKEVFSGNKYLTHDKEYIDSFKFDISIAHPISLLESNVISGFVYNENINSELRVSDTRSIVCTLPIYNTQTDEYETFIMTTPDNILFDNLFNNIFIEYNDNTLIIYNNNEIVSQQTLDDKYKIVYNPPILNLGNKEFVGFIKNIDYSIKVGDDNININIPAMYTLRDDTNNLLYENEGVRIITAPQLMNDETNLDLYGNTLIGVR